jgi:site-specific recombinase XerD
MATQPSIFEFPKRKIAPPRMLRGKRTHLAPEELIRVMQAARADGARTHLLCLLGFRHGLRVSELVRMRTTDDPAKHDSFLNVAQGMMVVRRLKNSETTIQPLMPSENPLFDEPSALRTYLSERDGEKAGDFLFASLQGGGLDPSMFSKIFIRVCRAAGIERSKSFCHILKHTRGSLLIKNGAEIAHVKKMLGHKAVSSTLVYAQLSDTDATEMAQTVDDKLFGEVL